MSQSCRHHLPCNCRRNAEVINYVQTKVKPRIESCIQDYLSLEETMEYLQNTDQIHPQTTKIVWEQLERENSDFFKAYYLRCEALSQIKTFNTLLEQQAALMLEHGLFDPTNLPPAIEDFLSQDPELQTRLTGRQANPSSHRSDVSPQSFQLPDLNEPIAHRSEVSPQSLPVPDLNYSIDLLQFPNDQQPEEHHDQQHHRSDVSSQSFPLPDLNYPIDLLQFPNDQQPEEHHDQQHHRSDVSSQRFPLPASNDSIVPIIADMKQDPSTPQLTDETPTGNVTGEAPKGNITNEVPTENITEEASMDSKMKKPVTD